MAAPFPAAADPAAAPPPAVAAPFPGADIAAQAEAVLYPGAEGTAVPGPAVPRYSESEVPPQGHRPAAADLVPRLAVPDEGMEPSHVALVGHILHDLRDLQDQVGLSYPLGRGGHPTGRWDTCQAGDHQGTYQVGGRQTAQEAPLVVVAAGPDLIESIEGDHQRSVVGPHPHHPQTSPCSQSQYLILAVRKVLQEEENNFGTRESPCYHENARKQENFGFSKRF